jgi:hypothetical protein
VSQTAHTIPGPSHCAIILAPSLAATAPPSRPIDCATGYWMLKATLVAALSPPVAPVNV